MRRSIAASMRLMPWTIFSGAIVGDDLHTALVSGSALGVRAKAGPVLRGFRGMGVEDGRRLLGGMPAGVAVVLIVPGSIAAVRPTALPAGRWGAAKDELMKSVESLFPFPAEQAVVGFVGRRLAGGEEAGYLVGADRRSLRAWTDVLERMLARPVDAVVSSHMALLGLGLQGDPERAVAEAGPGGPVRHRLVWGEVAELNGAASDGDSGSAVALPPAEDGAAGTLSGAELAAAGALAFASSGDRFAPLVGRVRTGGPRWLAAAVLVAVGGLMIWGASVVASWRTERGIARLERARADHALVLEESRRARAVARDLSARLEAVGRVFAGPSSGVLPAVRAALAAVPEGAFVYRIEVDAATVTIKGEAKRAGDVLRALEESEEFKGARDLDTPVAVEERGLEMFNIRADREPTNADGRSAG